MVLSFPPLKVEIVGTLAIRAIFFLVPSLLFLLIDSILPSVIVNIKTQGSSALPTRTGGARNSRKGGRPPWYFVIALSLINILLSVVLQAVIELLFTEVLHFRSALQVTTTLPMPWSIAKYVLRSLFLREVRLCTDSSIQTRTETGRFSNITSTASSFTQVPPPILANSIPPTFTPSRRLIPSRPTTTTHSHIFYSDSYPPIYPQSSSARISSPTSLPSR
jgi:hypothetical protein